MKKALLSIFAISLGFMASAQTTTSELPDANRTEKYTSVSETETVLAPVSPSTESSVVYYTQNFASGIPTAWRNYGTDISGNKLDSALWEYRGPLTFPASTVGSRGQWVGTRGPIASASALNGFVIFDSDYLDTRGVGAGSGAALAPHVGTLTSETIDLNASTGTIRVELSHYMRTFFGQTWIAFSPNGGLSWPDSIQLSLPAVNGETDNAVRELINLPANYTGNSMVKFQLIFDGRPGNANGNGYYFAMIDDIEIKDAPDNDIVVGGVSTNVVGLSLYVDGTIRGVDLLDSESTDRYGHVPTQQLKNNDGSLRNYTFDGAMLNFGSKAQTNAAIQVTATDGAGAQTYQNNSTPLTLLPSTSVIDTVRTNLNPPMTADDYVLAWEAISDSTDETPQNNVDTLRLRVTDRDMGNPAVYAMDFNGNDRAFLGTNSFTANGSEDFMQMATRYSVLSDDTIESVTILLSNLAQVGGIIRIFIHDTTGSETDITSWAPAALLESDFYVLSAADTIANEVTIPIPNSINGLPQDPKLTRGGYFVSAELQSNAGTTIIRIPSDETFTQHPWASLIYLDGDGRWYTNGNAFMIRANMQNNGITGINDPSDFGFEVSQNFPNPFEGSTSFYVNTVRPGDLSISVMNSLGQTVYNEARQDLTTGKHEVRINGANFASGLYFYTVDFNGNTVTKKMIVE